MKARRRGSMLIEMIVFISALTIMLALVSTLMHQMMGLDRGERARLVSASTIERLGRDLRADARSANGPADRADARLVLRSGGGRSVEYLVREKDVLRTVRTGEKVEGFEAYRRPAGTVARFESSTTNAIALRFDLDLKTPGDPTYRGYRIEAATGRDAALKGVTR